MMAESGDKGFDLSDLNVSKGTDGEYADEGTAAGLKG